MSDLDVKKTNFSQNKNIGSSQNLKDQVGDAGAEMKQRAGDALKASTDVAQDKLQEATDAVKEMASGAADQFRIRFINSNAAERISLSASLVTLGVPPEPSKAMRLLLLVASTQPPSMSRTPLRRSAMEASAISSTAPPILRNANPLHSLGSRCSQVLRRSAF